METCFGRLADDVIWTNIGSTKYSGTYHGNITAVMEYFDTELVNTVLGQ